METDWKARPAAEELDRLARWLKPWQAATSPVFHGIERPPAAGPSLFVGNHTLLGVLDIPLLWMELYARRGIFLRALGDHAHFKVPVWRDFLTRFGAVDGTRDNCSGLMQAGEHVLVFPGGAREVFKSKGEQYQLIWKERLGFVKMAVRHRCPVVPFAAVGADDVFEILRDRGDLRKSPLGALLEKLPIKDDWLMPLVKGAGPAALPNLERFYFWIGEPIEATRFGDDPEDVAALTALRDEVKRAVEDGIAMLLAEREKDPERTFKARVLRGLRGKAG